MLYTKECYRELQQVGKKVNENGKQLFSKAGVRLTLRAKHMYRKQLFSMADAW